jgi:spermidine/putrescine transport system ATP-binding protein
MIEARGVTKTFGDLRAVDDVDLIVKPGEFLSLLGPSGCGKTTLLRLIAGFETPDSGTILLSNQDVTRLPPYQRDVTQVFQSYALFPHMTVAQNIAFGLRMRKVPRHEISRRVTDALAMVSLPGTERKKPAQLSGGQQQRVALARAIVCNPKVLLLDEPLSALDAKLREAMQLELRQLHQKLGMTFIFVTHDQSEALTMSDRIAVMNRGKIEQIGVPMDVYLHPQTTFVANFVGSANIWSGQIVDGMLRVADDFAIAMPAAHRHAPSARVLVRPERIRVHAQRNSGRDLPVQVLDVIFSGATVRLPMRTASGVAIDALAVEADVERIRPGQQAFCRIDADDVHILPDEAHPPR